LKALLSKSSIGATLSRVRISPPPPVIQLLKVLIKHCSGEPAGRILYSTMVNTHDDDTGHYEGSLLEDIRDKVDAIAEAVSGVSGRVNQVEERLTKVEQDTRLIPAIQAAITDQAKDFKGLGKRVMALEKAAA
jgi:hypothetical protein